MVVLLSVLWTCGAPALSGLQVSLLEAAALAVVSIRLLLRLYSPGEATVTAAFPIDDEASFRQGFLRFTALDALPYLPAVALHYALAALILGRPCLPSLAIGIAQWVVIVSLAIAAVGWYPRLPYQNLAMIFGMGAVAAVYLLTERMLTSPSPVALACLRDATALLPTGWCNVALETGGLSGLSVAALAALLGWRGLRRCRRTYLGECRVVPPATAALTLPAPAPVQTAILRAEPFPRASAPARVALPRLRTGFWTAGPMEGLVARLLSPRLRVVADFMSVPTPRWTQQWMQGLKFALALLALSYPLRCLISRLPHTSEGEGFRFLAACSIPILFAFAASFPRWPLDGFRLHRIGDVWAPMFSGFPVAPKEIQKVGLTVVLVRLAFWTPLLAASVLASCASMDFDLSGVPAAAAAVAVFALGTQMLSLYSAFYSADRDAFAAKWDVLVGWLVAVPVLIEAGAHHPERLLPLGLFLAVLCCCLPLAIQALRLEHGHLDLIHRAPPSRPAATPSSCQREFYDLNRLLASGQSFRVLPQLDELIARRPRVAQNLVARASAYLAAERYQSALADCDQAVRLSPRSWESLCMRARVRIGMGQSDAAREDLDRATKVAPRRSDVWILRVWTEIVGSRPQEALRDLPHLETLQVPLLNRLLLKGAALSIAGQVEPSDDVFRCAAEAAAEQASAVHLECGVARACRGDLEAALASFDVALASISDRPRALIWRALVHLARHDHAAASQDARRILEGSDWREPWSMDAALYLYLAESDASLLDAAAAHCEDDRWPLPLIQCLRGCLSVGELLAAARDVGQEIRARAVMAWALHAAGRADAATPHVHWLRAQPPTLDSGLVLAAGLADIP